MESADPVGVPAAPGELDAEEESLRPCHGEGTLCTSEDGDQNESRGLFRAANPIYLELDEEEEEVAGGATPLAVCSLLVMMSVNEWFGYPDEHCRERASYSFNSLAGCLR